MIEKKMKNKKFSIEEVDNGFIVRVTDKDWDGCKEQTIVYELESQNESERLHTLKCILKKQFGDIFSINILFSELS